MTGSVKAKQCCEARIERGGVKEGLGGRREEGGREEGEWKRDVAFFSVCSVASLACCPCHHWGVCD